MTERRRQRDAARLKRQLQVDFSSVESLQEFKDLADELGTSYSQLALLFIEHGLADFKDGELDVAAYLIIAKMPWLRDFDLDIERYKEARLKRK